jgi:cytochrome P450
MTKVAGVEQDYVHRPDNRDLRHLPGAYGLPYLGFMIPLLRDPCAVLKTHYDRYGEVSRTRLTGQNMVWALGPDYNRELVMDPQQVFSARMGYDAALGDFFAGGLLVRDFAEHKFHRRIMQSAFKTSSMQHYIHAVNELAAGAVRKWPAAADFRFYPQIKSLLLEIGARVFVGVGLESDIERLNRAFLDMMAGTLSIVRRDWPGLTYRKGMNGRRALERYFEALVPAKRSDDGLDMMSHFSREHTEDGALYPDKVVADHMIFLLLAAHDTTTSALTMGSYYLARHPEWQERLRAEVDGLGHSLRYEDIGANVPLLEQTFHEILRMHPPVPQLMRRTIRDTELGGYRIPADTMVAISPIFCHRMDRYWKEPQAFDPDRFGPARQEHKQHPYLWMPFGGGAHKCIGLHFADLLFKCLMAEMLRNFSFSLPADYPESPSIMHFPFAKLTDDLPLLLEARTDA